MLVVWFENPVWRERGRQPCPLTRKNILLITPSHVCVYSFWRALNTSIHTEMPELWPANHCLTSTNHPKVQFVSLISLSPPAHLGPLQVKMNASWPVTLVEAIKLTGAGLQRYREWGLGSGIVCFCLALRLDQSCSWLRLGPPTSLTYGHRNTEINKCRWTEM